MRYQYKKRKDGSFDTALNWETPENHHDQRLGIMAALFGAILVVVIIGLI